jgi:hypothetical protein
MEFRVSVANKKQLILQMPMNRSLDRCGTNPNALTTQQCRQKTQNQPSVSPQRHDPAWPCRHGGTEHRAMFDFMAECICEEWRDVRIQAFGNPNLCTIDADCAIFASVVHLEYSNDCKVIPRVHISPQNVRKLAIVICNPNGTRPSQPDRHLDGYGSAPDIYRLSSAFPAFLRLAASALSLRNGRERGHTSARKCTSEPASVSSLSP